MTYGVIKTRNNHDINQYLRGGNSSNWWTIGLSVMATQASAITFLSTPGQAFTDGMTFVQFYFGLPPAIIVICMVFIPIYHKLKVYTAYEYLETRFDLKTRTLAAILFLVQRGLAAGITIYAPSIILSSVLGWDLKTLNIIIGILVIIYTLSGGTKAVSITQKQQMFVIMSGMFTAFFVIIDSLPNNVNFSDALNIAAIGGKMKVLDFSFDLNTRYTFGVVLLEGFFLLYLILELIKVKFKDICPENQLRKVNLVYFLTQFLKFQCNFSFFVELWYLFSFNLTLLLFISIQKQWKLLKIKKIPVMKKLLKVITI